MTVTTKHFGEIEVDESKTIRFTETLAGFPQCRDFILLHEENGEQSNEEQGNGSGFFCWLQSLDDGDVAFVLINVFTVMPEYKPLINFDDIADLGEYKDEDFLVYNIAVIPEDITKMSVNLKAPLIINTVDQKAKQVIVTNEEYHVRHYIFQEIQNKK